jgi:hypothetical protein
MNEAVEDFKALSLALKEILMPETPPNQQPAFAPSPLQEELKTSDPWDGDQAFKDLLVAKIFACPGSNAGDYAFLAWLYDFYLGASGGAVAPPVAAPAITVLSPDSTPANADATITITGTGFDAGASVMVGPTEVSPTGSQTATDLIVLVPAATISMAGAVDITVKNGDGQLSNTLSLTLS